MSSSSQAGLLAEIDWLGTNKLTVEAGRGFTGEATQHQIRTHFLGEPILLAAIAGVVGVLAGALATALYASSKG